MNPKNIQPAIDELMEKYLDGTITDADKQFLKQLTTMSQDLRFKQMVIKKRLRIQNEKTSFDD